MAGDHLVGIGADDTEALRQLRSRFAGHLGPDIDDVDFGIGVTSPRAAADPLCLLWRGDNVAHRSRSIALVIHHLDQLLGRFDDDKAPGLADVRDMTAIVSGRSASLVSNDLALKSASALHRLIERGLTTVTSPAIAYDISTKEIVVPTPLTATAPPPGAAESGCYELTGVHWSRADAAMGSGRSYDVVRFLGRLELRGDGGHQELLERLAAVAIERTRPVGSERSWIDAVTADLAS